VRAIYWFPNGVDPSDPDGTEIQLAGDPNGNFAELVGASGFGATDWVTQWSFSPGVNGGQLESVTAGIGSQTWRFLLSAENPQEFKATFRDLVRATNPTRGIGTFRVMDDISTPGGIVRDIRAVCVGGLRGDSLLARGLDTTEWPFDLNLETEEPYWTSPEPASAVWTGQPGRPTFPLVLRNNAFKLNPYGLLHVEAMELHGDIESWPTFYLNGPWWRAKFTNDRTGQWWQILRTPGVNEGLEVVTKPGFTSVTNPRGENRYGFTDGSELFSLLPGDSMSVECDGAGRFTRFAAQAKHIWESAL
jgi:hypothetical protein